MKPPSGSASAPAPYGRLRSFGRRAVSRAELLRFMQHEAETDVLVAAAALLGLPPLARAPAVAVQRDAAPGRRQEAPSPVRAIPEVTPRRAPLRCPVLLHASLLPKSAEDAPADTPRAIDVPWSATDAESVEAMLRPTGLPAPRNEPLLSRRRLLARLLPQLALDGGSVIDLPRLMQQFALAQQPKRLPHAPRRVAPYSVVILADQSEHLRCFRDDFLDVGQALSDVFGEGRCDMWWLPEGFEGPLLPAWEGMDERPVDSQTVLVILSDFEQAPDRRDATGLRWVDRAGQVLAIAPWRAPSSAWVRARRPVLASALITPTPTTGPTVADGDSQLQQLMEALSPAITVEPALVRALRLALLPGSSPWLEREVWRHADMLGSLRYRRWRPEQQRRWLERLADQPPWVLSTVHRVLGAQHRHVCQSQRDEEFALLAGLVMTRPDADTASSALAAAWRQEFDAVAANMARVASHLFHLAKPGGLPGVEPSATPLAVAARAGERLARMPKAIRRQAWAGARDLFMASDVALNRASRDALPAPDGVQIDLDALEKLDPVPNAARPVALMLRQEGPAVCLKPAPAAERALGGVRLLQWELAPGWMQLQAGETVSFIRITDQFSGVELHADPAGTGTALSGRWKQGGFDVLPLVRPRGAKSWSHDGFVGAVVDRLTHERDASFSQSDLLVEPSTRSGRIHGSVIGSSRLNAPGDPGLVWGFDAHGAFCHFRTSVKGRSIVQTFRHIEPGTFWMGSPDGVGDVDERPRHRVTLTRGYWLADTPCTQGLWEAVMGGNPSEFKEQADSAQRPVEQLSWDDVQGFLVKLNERLPPGVRAGLPTEAQWEYAARAGTQTAYAWGDEADGGRANWNGENKGTTAVKRYEPNAWGLYDMHGNVWEWCEGAWRAYEDRAEVDPPDVAGGDVRALRGGSWAHLPGLARSAYRFEIPRDSRWHDLGFRLVLRSESPDRGAASLGSRSEPRSSGWRGAPAPSAGRRGPARAKMG